MLNGLEYSYEQKYHSFCIEECFLTTLCESEINIAYMDI